MKTICTPGLFFVFFNFLSIINLDAQSYNNYNTSYIDVSEGLSNNYVRNVIQDDFGFKWIATEGGLNKYDGRTFKNFKPSNTSALQNENIEVVFRDSNGNLWIGTKSGGLTFYNSRDEKFHNYNQYLFTEEVGAIRVTTIAEDNEGRIFIGTWNNGLYVFDPEDSGTKIHYLPDRRINRLKSDKYGNIWIAEGNRLVKYDPSEDRLIGIGEYGSITSIVYDGTRNRLWVGINQRGLAYLDLEDYTFHKSDLLSEKDLNIECLAVDSSDRLFVGTWGQGLYISDIGIQKFEKYSLLPSSLEFNNTSYESILDIHLDENEIIWVSTAFGGIVKLMSVNNFMSLEDFIIDRSLSDNNLFALKVDSKNKMWFGTYGKGVSILNNKSLNGLENLPITKVNVFLESKSAMLIGAREGLFAVSIDDATKKIAELTDNKIGKVTSLHYSGDDKLWVGTQQDGIIIFDDFNDKSLSQRCISIPKWSGADRISKIEEDMEGNIWIGTFNGLYIYEKKRNAFIYVDSLLKKPLPSAIINDMYLDAQNEKLWIALSGGLVELSIDDANVKTLELHGTNDGLRNEFVTSVIKGKDGNIWVGTAFGIAKYLPERNVFENYVNSDGVPVHSFNIKSVTTNNAGQLLFGASNGIAVFDPIEITYNQVDPEVLFTSLSINGESADVGEEINGNIILNKSLQSTSGISLTYKDEAFAFTVSTLDYLGDENVLFSYRLKGFNDNWSLSSSNREIRFINLNPGNYELEVKASRDNYHWSNVASKKIHVIAPPWATWYAYLFYVLFISGLALLINFVTRKQTYLKANLEVERIAREKEHDLSEAKIKFFTNISHEFRTPLTLILSPITELLTDQNITGKIRERLTTVEKNASRLLQLINQLLDFRKSENGLLQMRVATGDFVAFANEVFLSFKAHADSKNIKYSFKANPKRLLIPFDRDKMEIVLVNLLSNAFKYSTEGGYVKFILEESENNLFIQIIDSGIGIKPKDLDKIFDRFYQIRTTESAKIMGSGIGLSLAKNIVLLHHGELTAASVPDKETSFTVQLPVENSGFSADEYISDFKGSEDRSAYIDLDESRTPEDIDIQVDDDKPTVLVVDDNSEIRDYLTSLMKEENYNVISASNGVEALQKANELQPDMIISDVMMPEMDGITFCNTIKSDMSTSHIPVILLTARTSTVFEVSGLQTGAEDYIKKPFHPTILKTRVSSILGNRGKIREYFVNKLRFEPSEQIEAPGTEEKFIQQAITIIEEHIHDADFGIETLMDSLAMSKSTLYRKLKSLTGLSITAFIRSVKLKKAAELILSVDWKLNHVAYESGFNDYKYFKTCFQEQFGCLPSEYRNKKVVS